MYNVTVRGASINECPNLSKEEREQIEWTLVDYSSEIMGEETVVFPVSLVNELATIVTEEWEQVAFAKLTKWISEFSIDEVTLKSVKGGTT